MIFPAISGWKQCMVIIRTNRVKGGLKGLPVRDIDCGHSAEILPGSNVYSLNTMWLVGVVIQPDDFSSDGYNDSSTGFNRPIIRKGNCYRRLGGGGRGWC